VIRTVVLGLGSIGSGSGATAQFPTRSHVGAILATPGMKLVGAVDPSPDARGRASERWKFGPDTRVAADLSEIPAEPIDAVVVCGPTDTRKNMVLAAARRSPRVLVIEKPLARSQEEGRLLLAAAKAAGSTVLVSFQRRFDPRHAALRNMISEQPVSVVARYGKGLLNYGSHLVDFFLSWFGHVSAVQAIGPATRGIDPNISFRCRMGGGFDAWTIALNDLEYDQFEIDLFFARSRIELRNGGVEILRHVSVPDRYYPGYAQLGEPQRLYPAGAVSGFREMYLAICDHLRSGASLPGCSGEDALAGLAVLDAVRMSAANRGLEIQLRP
jgi:predicted dehydrogenase